MKNVLKLGLILAVVGIILSVVYRYVNIEFLFSWKSMVIGLIISTTILIILGRKFLRQEDSRLGYGEAVKNLFLATLISSILTTSFGIILFGNDAEMKTEYEKYEIETQEASIRFAANLAGQSEAEQEAAVEEMREMREKGEMSGTGYPFKWSSFPMIFGMSAIGNLLFCLVIALFVREKESQHA